MEKAIPNGIFTVENKEKKTHRTVKIHTARRGNLEGKRIISMLIGCNNNTDYAGFGFVGDDNKITVWSKHSGNAVKIWLARFVADYFVKNQPVPEKIGFFVEKRCIRCNRRLTTPESVEAGIGPECAGKI